MLFITQVSTTCFGSYGHLQVGRLTTNLRLVYGGGGLGLGGGTRSHVC